MTPGRPSWMRLPGAIFSTAELKSGLQKLLRRRDPRAYDIARLLLETPESTQALLRRLVTIAAEEGTLGVVPEAMELLTAYGRKETRAAVTRDAVLRVISRVMATSRDKDPANLKGWSRVTEEVILPAERAAVALWQTWSVERGQEVLTATWAALPDGLTKDVILAMRRRAGMSVLDDDLKMFCGIALALAERERAGETPVLPVEEEPVPPASPVETLPWWCFDPHIAVGKRALKQILAISPYADWNRAFAIWFRLSSDQLAGYVEREGWRAKQFARDVTPEDQAWWESVEPIARRVIETDLARRTPGPIPIDHEKEVQQMALTLDDPQVQALREERRRLRDQAKALRGQDREARLQLQAAKQAQRAEAQAQRATGKRLREARRELHAVVRNVLRQGDPAVVEAAVAAIRVQVGDPDAAA